MSRTVLSDWALNVLGLPERGVKSRELLSFSKPEDFERMWNYPLSTADIMSLTGYSVRQSVGLRARRLGLPPRPKFGNGMNFRPLSDWIIDRANEAMDAAARATASRMEDERRKVDERLKR